MKRRDYKSRDKAIRDAASFADIWECLNCKRMNLPRFEKCPRCNTPRR